MSYHVFLSFRGEDTRKTFTSHLYKALWDKGFRTFLDDDGIERGENVKSELDKAIKEARSSIVVLSKGYSSSGWCLDELVMILERTRTPSGSGHVVLPVFYDVDPSNVRWQTGEFGKAFSDNVLELLNAETDENKKECLRKKVEGWKRALKEVADLAGMVLQNQADGNEAKFIQEIVRKIGDKVNPIVLHVADNPVGIESRVRNINSWLQDEFKVGIAVIYGMGGIGKTTIAKFAFNLNFQRFEASSFLSNIGEISKGPEGLVRFQRQFLSNILKRDKEEVWSVDEGISRIKEFIGRKRVLVVLDDVANRAQFDAIIGSRDWFHRGSKIILTTRNIYLLKANEVDEKFEVTGLNSNESLELFSWHAFGQDHPIKDYSKLSQQVVKHCKGLPLALQVLGCSLSNRSLDKWEETLQKLTDIPHTDVLKKLQISYDSLDEHDRELFLHIACFFNGKGKDFLVRILYDHYPTAGIQTLVERCLITVNGYNKVMMHQLLQQMGREIVRQESPWELGKRSRLWHHKDSVEVLRDKIGTETIKGLYLDMHHVLEKDSQFTENFHVSNVKRPRFEELNRESLSSEQGYSLKRHCLSLFNWRSTNNVGRSSDQVELWTDAFTRMHNLIFLQLNNVEIKGIFADFPGGLRSLTWHGFSLTSITGDMFMTSLKILNLSYSHGLKNTPKFTDLPKLEKLVLKYCISLVEVHESIGKLKRLILLNLRGCKNLKTLPREICHLTSLEKLILSGCSKLGQLPAELEQMKSLTVLHADGISQDIGDDGSWTSRVWSLVFKPRKSPKTLPSLPGSLVELSLPNCNLSSDDLAKCLGGSFSVLKELNLSKNPFSSLPESIKGLTLLKSLHLDYCSRLQSLPELPMSLECLDLPHCFSLECITNLPNLSTTLVYDMFECCGVVEGQGMFKLESLRNADAEIINKMGLSSELKTLGCFEVELWSMLSESHLKKKRGLKVLYEFGIYSIYLRRISEVPASWCSSNKRMGTSVTFNVPSVPNLRIQALKIYILYSWAPESFFSGFKDHIILTNITKGLLWAYHPCFVGDPTNEDMTMAWLIHWNIGDQIILEASDEMNVFAQLSFNTWGTEIGVRIVYEETEESSQNNKAYPRRQDVTNVEDLSAYQVRPGNFHLSHYHKHEIEIAHRYENNCWCTFFKTDEEDVHRDEKCYRLSNYFEQHVNKGRMWPGFLETDEEDEINQ